MDNPIKIVFAGTPDFAVPFLKSLINDPDFGVVGVITQLDKPIGRKKVITPPPVKELAQKHNFKIFQPDTLNENQELIKDLKKIEFDLLVVVAYGLIIPQEILSIAKTGNINVHPSLLPKYRGASPIQAAILAGDDVSGITIMLMDSKMDHGPILSQIEVGLSDNETSETLMKKMTESVVPLLSETIKKYMAQEINPQEQNHDQATYCQTIKKEDAKIDWHQSAEVIEKQIRAFYPWPIAWTKFDNKRLKIFPLTKILTEKKQPGEIFISENKLAIGCDENSLLIDKLQLEGKKEIKSQDFIRGYNDLAGKFFE